MWSPPGTTALGLLSLVAVLRFGVGCVTSTTAHLRTDDAPALVLAVGAAPEQIMVYPVKDIGRAYDVVGVVIAASSTGDQPGATYALLQKEAATLGADAVVDARMEIDMGFWSAAVKVTGMAVKLR